MKKWVVYGTLCMAAFASAGQTGQKDRTQAIWAIAAERMQRQNDLWFKNGDYPRVIQSMRFLAILFPHNYDIVTNLGWMLENVEKRTEALAIYIKYRENFPDDPEASFPEADYYFKKKVYEKVPSLIEPSLKVGSGPSPNSYRILAHSYERLNLLSDSARIWKQYVQKHPDDLPAKNNLTRVEKKMHGTGG